MANERIVKILEDDFIDMLWERIELRDYSNRFPDEFWEGVIDFLVDTDYFIDNKPEYNTPSYIIDNISINGSIYNYEDFLKQYGKYDDELLNMTEDEIEDTVEEICEEEGYDIIAGYVIVNWGL